MSSITDCQTRVSNLLDSIIMIAAAQKVIDDHLVSTYHGLPAPCLPELLKDTDEPAGESCPLESDAKQINFAHRQFTKATLLSLVDDLKAYSKAEEDDFAKLGRSVEEQAMAIDVQSSEPLVALPQITELVSNGAFRMFTVFHGCMHGL